MRLDPLLKRLTADAALQRAAKQRIKRRVMQRIGALPLQEVHTSLAVPSAAKARIWNQVLARIVVPETANLLDRVRSLLTPPADLHLYLRQRLMPHLQTVPVASGYAPMKWVASMVLAAFMVYASPALFLTKTTLAETDVSLVPTGGEVFVQVGQDWVPVPEQTILEANTTIRTGNGQASVVFHDDAVVRLGSNTTINISNLQDRSEPVAQALPPAFSLVEGSVWLQGLTPASAGGIAVAVNDGQVIVNEGSVSIDSYNGAADVRVWDRRAAVWFQADQVPLVVGDRTQLKKDSALVVKNIQSDQFQEEWPKENLAKDAVHRRYIAHLQHERLAARAGILPTSTLYTAKRIAEKVDVYLTFDEEARVQKRLDQANTRLNEAAALIAEGSGSSVEVTDILASYQTEIADIASGSGGNAVTQALIQQSVTEAFADVSASLPGDDSYVLKKTVLETTTELPDSPTTVEDMSGALLVDALDALNKSVEIGEFNNVQQTWQDLQPYLATLETEDTAENEELRKEAQSILERVATVVREQHKSAVTSVNPELLDDIMAYAPVVDIAQQQLSDDDVIGIISNTMERVYTFKMPQSRANQLRAELQSISAQNPEEAGRILRAVYKALPDESFLRDVVRRELVDLRWEIAGENYQQ